jgi:superfamily II DNA or RNA helicase
MPPRKKNARKLSHEPGNARQPLSKAQLAGLAEKIQTKFNWKHTPHLYQLEAIEGQLQMRDTLVHAGTGAGKTTIAAGPHAHESSAGKVTLMISPLIALHDEQVSACLFSMATCLPYFPRSKHFARNSSSRPRR